MAWIVNEVNSGVIISRILEGGGETTPITPLIYATVSSWSVPAQFLRYFFPIHPIVQFYRYIYLIHPIVQILRLFFPIYPSSLTVLFWWCIFRPKHIRYTPLLTYAKSAIQHIRSTSTWFYSCDMDMWPQRPAPKPVLAAALSLLAAARGPESV